MIADTSSLAFFLLLVSSSLASLANDPPPKPFDYKPSTPFRLLLPTHAGTVDVANAVRGFGMFNESYTLCGKASYKIGSRGVNEMRMDCTPHPNRVVVPVDAASFKEIVGGSNFLFQNCQGVQSCKTNPTWTNVYNGDQVSTVTPSTINDDETVNMCKSGSSLLFSNEPRREECNNPNVPGYNDVPKDNKYQYHIVPRWKTNDVGFFEILRTFTYNGMGKPRPPTYYRTNTFAKIPDPTKLEEDNVWKDCHHGCDVGEIVKLTMKAGSWKTLLYLKGKTQGIKLCIDPEHFLDDKRAPICKEKFELYIMPRNGLVIWPKSGRASMMELKPRAIADAEIYVIEVGFGYGDKVNGKLPGEFYVANMFREVVVSDSEWWDATAASKVAFFFEKSDDLEENKGIISQNIEIGKTFISKKDVGKVHKIDGEGESGDETGEGKEKLLAPPPPKIEPNIPTTTVPPVRYINNPDYQTGSNEEENPNTYTPGKWWAWGLFVGFIIGSLLGTVIIGGIFYVLRRTVYGFWYRGMYKRYGCDVSGTTGGITGVGFGNTTTGAITVGGTTGGATTAGTTGGTTGSSTTTGGASTIAI